MIGACDYDRVSYKLYEPNWKETWRVLFAEWYRKTFRWTYGQNCVYATRKNSAFSGYNDVCDNIDNIHMCADFFRKFCDTVACHDNTHLVTILHLLHRILKEIIVLYVK